MSFTSWYIRRSFSKGDRKRDEGLSIPEDVCYIRDIPYGADPVWNTLDIAYPKDRSVKLPVIVSVHGGAYVYGSTKEYQFYSASLAQRGFSVINFNYRLAPETRYPGQLHDLNEVIRWMIAHAPEYPFDLNNIFLVGDSAGAQMLSQYMVLCTNEEYRKTLDIVPPEFTVRAIGLNCGMYDIERMISDKGNRGIVNDYLGKDHLKWADSFKVLEYIDDRFPPTYLFSAGGDFLLKECRPMYELLKEKGIECQMKIYGDKDTGHVFHLNMRSNIGKQANDDETGFFRKFIV